MHWVTLVGGMFVEAKDMLSVIVADDGILKSRFVARYFN